MKRRPSTQLTKIILLVSFLILFGRLLFAGIASISHHQERREAQQVELDSFTRITYSCKFIGV